MKWIGGGHHAFGDDINEQGSHHVNAIMGHVRTAGGAGAAALKKAGADKGANNVGKGTTTATKAEEGTERGLQNVDNKKTISG